MKKTLITKLICCLKMPANIAIELSFGK
jgi:hypothetical protein